MTSLTRRITNLLDPLEETYSSAGCAVPAVREVPAAELDQPFRDLLAHGRDMTSTLESFCADTLHLRVMRMHRNAGELVRQVVLQTDASNRPVEFGAIRIALEPFSDDAQADILACHRPLGAILTHREIPYRSQPTAFFAIESDEITARAFSLEQPATLFGRHNILTTPTDELIAEVVEILAPRDLLPSRIA